MKKVLILVVFFGAAGPALVAQNLVTRSNPFGVDFSDPKKVIATTVPVITWITPVAETTYSQENMYKVKFEIDSEKSLKSISISMRETDAGDPLTILPVKVDPNESNKASFERNVRLMDGDNFLEIVVENIDGMKASSQKLIRVGANVLADATKLDRRDLALVFVTDKYDHWPGLVNPVFDGNTVAEILRKTYGFNVEVVENATQAEILGKLRGYIEKKYKPLDQLFLFFAGHGSYDAQLGEGSLVPKDALLDDEAKISYLSYNRLRSVVNNIPCEHIFLTMDVCFGGTFDQKLASRGLDDEVYKEKTPAEFVTQKLTNKTRKFLTSGGKRYVSDGVPGQHSPFARAFIEALLSRGGKDGILTLSELTPYVEVLKMTPIFGEFGDNAPGSDFVFIAR